MILLRARIPGTGEWTNICIQTPGPDSDEEDDLERNIASVIGAPLSTSSLHVQRLNDEGQWEDLE